MTFGRVWLGSAILVFAVSLLWSLATPIGAAPDEPAQLVKAAATVRGQLSGPAVRGQPHAVVRMTVPAAFAAGERIPDCFAGNPRQPASCAPPWRDVERPVATSTYVGRDPPLYYLVVGLPSLVSASALAVRSMRAVSAAISAALLGLALATAATWSRSRLLLVAIVVAATPLVLFLSGVVNPNSVEIAAAVSTWVAGIVLVTEHVHDPPRPLVVVFVAAGATLAVSRALSPLWLAGILGVLWLLDPRGARRLVTRRGPPRTGVAMLAVVAAVAAGYSVVQDSFAIVPSIDRVSRGASLSHIVSSSVGHTLGYVNQAVGIFGWLDTPSPAITVELWFAATGALIILGVACATRRHLWGLAAVAAAAVVVPTAITISHARVDGLVGQARDYFAIFVGLPLLAAAATSQAAVPSRVLRRVALLVVAALAVAGVAAFVVALQRNVVGIHSALSDLLHPPSRSWHPPLGPAVLVVGAAAAIGALNAWIAFLTLRSEPEPARREPDAPPATTSPAARRGVPQRSG